MKKYLFTIVSIVSLIFSTLPVYANSISHTNKHNLPYYIETTIEDSSVSSLHNVATFSTTKTVTKTKTTKIKNESGSVLWSVSITATFSYNGSTSKCISYSHNATSYCTNYAIKSVSSSKYQNSATATAIAAYSNGKISKDYLQSVTIKCSKNGAVS